MPTLKNDGNSAAPRAHDARLHGQRQHGLDTLRALAIVVVMVFHLQTYLPEFLEPVGRVGWMGVDIFFVLSGFLIGSQLLKPYLRGQKLSLADFYRRRAFRILPAYLLMVLLYFTVPAWRESPGISPPWMFLTFTQNFFIDYSVHQAFSFAWSLCVEEHFYLVLPLLVLLLMKRPSFRRTVALLAAVALAGMAARGYVLFHILRPLSNTDDGFGLAYLERIYYPTYMRLDGLLVGVSLALVKTFRPHWWAALAARGHAATLGGTIFVATAIWLFRDRFSSVTGVAAWGTVIGFPILSIGFGLLLLSSVSRNGLLNRFRIPGAELVATLAFSLYLTHKEAVHLDRLLLPSLTAEPGFGSLCLYAATCLAVAATLYVCVERPFMLLRDRLSVGKIPAADQAMLDSAAI